MAQATTDLPRHSRGDADGSDDEFFRSFTAVITQLRRRTGDADTSARTFLLAHVDRLAPVRMSDLATHACLDLSTVSRHLRGLEEQGLVTRSPDPADGRATLLDLSDSGRDALDRAVRARTQLIASATGDWSDADRATLAHLMTRLAHDLEPTA
jgi:DNA-binding MarR family transcriptional regulator